MENGRLRMVREWPRIGSHAGALDCVLSGKTGPRVEIVLSHAGSDGRIVQALMQAGVDGIVVAGTGNGTLHEQLEEVLLQALDGGIRVLRSTRCSLGQVLDIEGDRIPASNRPPVKARIDLMLDLIEAAAAPAAQVSR